MLSFKPITLESLPEINYYFQQHNYRTCDFTIGGLFMWASYFKYEYAICNKTLFIKGVSEINLSETAFSIPIGKLPPENSILVLMDYCREKKIKLILSAVPEDITNDLRDKFSFNVMKLENWSDYLYEIQSLASLSGKLYNKKRNHVNKFLQLYPNYSYSRINNNNVAEIIPFFQKYNVLNSKDSPLFQNEADMTEFILKNYFRFDFIGAYLKINDDVAGFIVGEILHDTLYIHIGKANKDYEGVYEYLNKTFIADVLNNYPYLNYVNKEEDVGDEGLRKSKLSYHPIALLHKYNLEFC